MGEHIVKHKGITSPVKIFIGCHGNSMWHPLPAPFGIIGHSQPLTFIISGIYTVKGIGYFYVTGIERAALVTYRLKGQDLFNCKISGFAYD